MVVQKVKRIGWTTKPSEADRIIYEYKSDHPDTMLIAYNEKEHGNFGANGIAVYLMKSDYK